MPGLVVFGRRWMIGSDDLVFPALVEILVRITWLMAIVIVVAIHHSNLYCSGGNLLYIYLLGTIILNPLVILLCLALAYSSARGTITSSWTRHRVAPLLYVRMLLFVPEIAWSIIGVYWAFDESIGCERPVVKIIKATAISSLCLVLIFLVVMAIIFDPLGAMSLNPPRPRSRSSSCVSQSSEHLYRHEAAKVWETRCRLLCCCAGNDEHSKAAFSDIAKLFATFFEGVDLVPSDIAAGLVLLQIQQEKQKRWNTIQAKRTAAAASRSEPSVQRPLRGDPAQIQDGGTDAGLSASTSPEGAAVAASGVDVGLSASTSAGAAPEGAAVAAEGASGVDVRPGASTAPKEWMNVRNATHFVKFALGVYGWPLYAYMHPVMGWFRLWGKIRCCSCVRQSSAVDDNCVGCNMAAIRKQTGLRDEHIIHASFHNRTYEVAFFVAVDEETESIILSIRGTLSLGDALTDLSAESCSMSMDVDGDPQTPGRAHKGILRSAQYVKAMLEQQHLLETAFQGREHYTLVVMGHSLGGGCASILACLLRPAHPRLQCFAYSPPGGLLNMAATIESQEYVCSVVLGKDLVPRLSIHAMEDLKFKVLTAVHDCDRPKYRILMRGVWYAIFGMPTLDVAVMETDSEPTSGGTSPRRPLLGSREETRSRSGSTVEEALRDSFMKISEARFCQEKMLLPGKIMYITEASPGGRFFGSPVYQVTWAGTQTFQEVIFSPKMVTDHLPDVVLRALSQLNEANTEPLPSATAPAY
ncbi:PREDICTED: sn1-specific diacylglycerol lipase beta-like [Priapulus caudatus]|uniref:sn-1-specific diacylglycerol lipase n=1 Tax=Priapulus caudatus TaxID=37621 RepID=A0ABM1EJJ7_PRICU|nr:PREDICTED: sn1-specific diacylglycerol lipase beta-like [Priapulus caudatus]